MKKLILLIIVLGLLISCNTNIDENNKVVLLQVDYQTNVFEGGKELSFSSSSTFTISSTYQAPGDFGSVQLYYSELDELLFNGTIIWDGTGQIVYPHIYGSSFFSTSDDSVQMPNTSLFENVMYDEFAHYPDTISYSNIWNSIANLLIVEKYRDLNPDGKVHLFLYTPSVGEGNPADWDWFVILNN